VHGDVGGRDARRKQHAIAAACIAGDDLHPLTNTERVGVVAIAAVQPVPTRAAVQGVVAQRTEQRVFTFIAEEHVIAGTPRDTVVTLVSMNCVVTGAG
jgi:hypothetical protein